MKKLFLFALALTALALTQTGCKTVHTQTAPEGAYNIRKPADTTKAVRQNEGVLIERVY